MPLGIKRERVLNFGSPSTKYFRIRILKFSLTNKSEKYLFHVENE